MSKTKPVIKGLNDSYYVGQVLEATCSSPSSDPPQHLAWYINNEKVSEILLLYSLR